MTRAAVEAADLETPADVMVELGVMPEELVTSLVEAHDGRLRQQAFTEYTDWSPSTTSQLLQDLEADGHVVRVKVGNEKIVALPDDALADDALQETAADDAPSTDPRDAKSG